MAASIQSAVRGAVETSATMSTDTPPHAISPARPLRVAARVTVALHVIGLVPAVAATVSAGTPVMIAG
jgi:hypothetical protein